MAKLNAESKNKESKGSKSPGIIKNRTKDKKVVVMFNPKYDRGQNPDKLWISDINDYIDIGETVELPARTVEWIQKQGKKEEILQKKGNKLKRTGNYQFIPRFKVISTG